MRRRDFIAVVGGAAALGPLHLSRAQPTELPVVGFLTGGALENAPYSAAFWQALAGEGFVEGRTVVVEAREAKGQVGRLPSLAADLVQRNVTVIAAVAGAAAVRAAMAATDRIPIVFTSGSDPVALGIVPNLARPPGNVTGVSSLTSESATKRLGLVHELMPTASRIAFLVNPTGPNGAAEMKPLMSAQGRIVIHNAGSEDEIDKAFAVMARSRTKALIVGLDPFFVIQRARIVEAASQRRIPTVYADRAFVTVGGLVSYGTDIRDVYRQAGLYVARILHGAKPADLPILQSTKFELVVNMKTAKALGLAIPPTLLARADEVIE